jgi:hypothetical protein
MFVGKARGQPGVEYLNLRQKLVSVTYLLTNNGIEYYSKNLCSEGLLTIELSFEEEKLESFG